MKIIASFFAIAAIAVVSIEIDRNTFTSTEFMKAEFYNIENSIYNAEQKMITAEMNFETILEGATYGIN